MKRIIRLIIFTIFISVLMTLFVFSISAEVYIGNCGANGSNITFSLDTETGILSIAGEGEMKDYTYSNELYYADTPWISYRNLIRQIKIDNGITHIGNYAFYELSSVVETVIIPESVISIGDNAFQLCESVEGIMIPNSVTKIGKYAFDCCMSIKSIIIPDGVTNIENSTFFWCCSLESVTIPDSIKSIADYAFERCDNIIVVNYKGSEDAWERITIGEHNENLTEADIHFDANKEELNSTTAAEENESIGRGMRIFVLVIFFIVLSLIVLWAILYY